MADLASAAGERSARGMLDVLDRFLAEADQEQAQMLWDVLTALRGPDEPGEPKMTTTMVVRSVAFPRVARMGGGIERVSAGFRVDEMTRDHLEEARAYVNDGSGIHFGNHHFGNHVRFAVSALLQMGLPR